jgi:hypothetical protein
MNVAVPENAASGVSAARLPSLSATKVGRGYPSAAGDPGHTSGGAQ